MSPLGNDKDGNDNDDKENKEEVNVNAEELLQQPEFQNEETLLKLHLKLQPGRSLQSNDDNVLPSIQKFIQSFPFAAVLPVQPLQYLPTADGGVAVTFLRKKTKEKGSIDGGLRFFILPHSSVEEEQQGEDSLEIVVKRNSQGQTCAKIFAEKLIVTAFVKAFSSSSTSTCSTEGTPTTTITTNQEPPTKELVTIESVFHKWMTS